MYNDPFILYEHIYNLSKVRLDLAINEYFTSDEYSNTIKYLDLLLEEKYEELIDFKIEEI